MTREELEDQRFDREFDGINAWIADESDIETETEE